MTEIDWKRILICYIDHVYTMEGTTFGEDSYPGLDEQEAACLNACVDVVLEIAKNRIPIERLLDYSDTIREIEALPTPFLDKAKKGIL